MLTITPTFTLTPLLVKSHFGGGPGQIALMEGLSGIDMTAVLQIVIPNQLRGRALALVGPLSEWAGVRGVFVVGDVLSALACLAGFLSPALLRLKNLPVAPQVRRFGQET